MGNTPEKEVLQDHSHAYLNVEDEAWQILKNSLSTLQNYESRLNIEEGSLNLNSIDESWKTKLEILQIPKNLIKLDLSQNKWFSKFKHDVFFPRLSSIKEFKIQECELDSLSAQICGMAQLRKFWVSRNSLVTLPLQLGMLSNLHYLDCSENQLKEIPNELFNCPLEILILNKNELRTLSPYIGSLQSSLTVLNLSDNFLREIPSEIGELKLLKKCYLDHNELETLPSTISNLHRLKELNVSSNQITHFPSSIAQLTNLQLFDVSENIIQVPPENMNNIESLLQFLSTQKTPKVTPIRKHRSRVSSLTDTSKTPKKEPTKEFLVIESKKYLFQFRGKKNILVKKVDLTTKALNHGSSYLLDCEKKLYLWFGNQSNPRTQAKAKYFAQKIREETFSPIIFVDIKDQTSEFWKIVTGDKNLIGPPNDKEDVENTAKLSSKLWRFSEASGRLDIRAWMGQILSKDMLDSSASYVLDCESLIFVWIGMYSSHSERTWAMLKAEELISQSWRNTSAEIFWIIDGQESLLFRDQFHDWADKQWENLLTTQTQTSPQKLSSVQKSITFSGPLSSTASKKASLSEEDKRLIGKMDDQSQLNQLSEEDKALIRKMEEQNQWLINETKRLDSLKKQAPSSSTQELLGTTSPNLQDVIADKKNAIIHRNLTIHPQKVVSEDFSPKMSPRSSRESPKLQKLESPQIQKRESPKQPKIESPKLPKQDLVQHSLDLASPLESVSKLGINQKSKPKIPGRRLPQRNPIRGRLEMEAEDAKFRSENGEANEVKPPAVTLGIGSQLGGFGLLYALKPDMVSQQQLRSRSNSADISGAPRLIQIYGRRNIFVRQLPISVQSLQLGGCFLLDSGKGEGVIYQWNAPQSNRIEKGKAMDVAKSIKDKERSGMARVIVLDQDQEKEGKFWSYFGENSRPSNLTIVPFSSSVEKEVWEAIQLFQVVPDTSKSPNDPNNLEIIEIARGKIYKESLVEELCYILDAVTEMYVWCGKKASLKLKNGAIKLAQNLHNDKDFWTVPLLREFPGSETVLFREKFCNWGSIPIQMQQVPVGLNTAPTRTQKPIDVLELHQPRNRQNSVYIDDGNGKVQVWKVDDFKKVEIPKEKYGEFYCGESYIVLYTYIWKNKDCYLIYFWQGRKSRVQEKGSSALLTIQLDDQLQGQAKEVRVVQNKEPEHFLRIFKGKFFIHLGRDESGDESKANTPSNEAKMWQVGGTNEWDVKAIQIPCAARFLNSRFSYIITKDESSYVWHGMAASEHEKAFAERSATFGNLNKVVIRMEEGSETPQFWEAIGGNSVYWVHHKKQRFTPRLFQCSIGSGAFAVDEIISFSQDDLSTDDVFFLDAFDEVYVWVGDKCDPKEFRKAMETALEYHKKAPDNRVTDKNKVFCIYQGKEPIQFVTHFHGWNFGPNLDHVTISDSLPLVIDLLKEYTRSYTYEELISRKFPKGFDTTQLENYLSDEEFIKIFGVTREEFSKYPVWKAQKIKSTLGLY